MQQPQEIEVWYILPAIRRELAKVMIEKYSLTQKEVAKILNVTEPAISQYLKSKRAKEVKFTKATMVKIEESVDKIIKDNSVLIEEMQKLCTSVKDNMTLCKIHRMKNPDLSKECKVCLVNKK